MDDFKISFDDFVSELSKDWICLEVWFCVDNYPDYQDCWLGKMIERETNLPIYWYGLVEDGSQAYDFLTIDEFLSAKAFQGKSIKDIWDLVSLYSFNGGNADDWFGRK